MDLTKLGSFLSPFGSLCVWESIFSKEGVRVVAAFKLCIESIRWLIVVLESWFFLFLKISILAFIWLYS